METNKNLIKSITLSLASPEDILTWSHGEVTKPETINYKSQKPEKDGLFCEKIFGPVKDYECACGRYKKIKNKGVICERCGVEVTESIVRRSRFGHIELNAPIAHIWMLKTTPSKISLVLNLRLKELEEIIYFVSHIVVNPGRTGLKKLEVLDQMNGRKRLLYALNNVYKNEELTDKQKENVEVYMEILKDEGQNYNFKEIGDYLNELVGAEFGIGAEVIEILLKQVNIKQEIAQIRKEIVKNSTETPKLVKRLAILEAFLKSNNKLEWMILRRLPVMPPSLRPIIQLDGGRFTSSDINDLYRRVLIRNDRLKKMIEAEAPDIIVNNEKRMLQEAVDAVLDNSRKSKPFLTKDKRPLKSLSDSLKGKQGRFRQNLLGKRVDFSARSVIVVGPDLKMYECGIPRDIALTLFKPFIISELLKNNEDQKLNIKIIERKIAKRTDDVWAILEEVIKTRPVILNRAPTLHRLGIQAFEPKLIKGKAIRLHPLVTPAFNADFDGDQMAVHLPLSDLAIAEARALLIGSKNILGLKDGKPIVTPTQDMVLGCYYLTRENRENLKHDDGMHIFGSPEEAISCYEHGKVNLDDAVLITVNAYPEKPFTDDQKNGYILTTVGKIIINNSLPKKMVFINSGAYISGLEFLPANDVFVLNKKSPKTATLVSSFEQLAKHALSTPNNLPFTKKTLHQIIINLYENFKDETPELLDQIKDLGFKYSTKSAVTISIHDLQLQSSEKGKNSNFAEVQKLKKELFKEIENDIEIYSKLFSRGLLTNGERKSKVISEWSTVKDKVENKIKEVLNNENIKENPLYMIMDSGARGNISNFTQLVGMRGLMSNPKGEIMELSIKSSFVEGLAISEFFISTHGARKGMADTALKTADSGYLTRRLVDVSQEVTIKEADCGTNHGFIIKDIVDTKTHSIIIPLAKRIIGRCSLLDVYNKAGKIIVKANELITEDMAEQITAAGIKEVEIRSILTCATHGGVCQKCYGLHLADNELVKIGEPVGVIAAQSIGEPGTQLTMRTFHTGGVASGSDITQGLPRIKELFDVTMPKGRVAIISKVDGKVVQIEDDGYGRYKIVIEYKRFDNETKKEITEYDNYLTNFNAKLRVKVDDEVKIAQKLTDGSIDLNKLLKIADIYEVQQYILKEVQRVYKTQGIDINDKYIEIILRQMMNRVVIIDSGDTNLLPGSRITISEFKKINAEMFAKGKKPPFAKSILLGIKKAPLDSDSFLSAASFQDTTRILAQAAIASKKDQLVGIKENVILGNLIHVGTGSLTNEEVLELGEIAKSKQY